MNYLIQTVKVQRLGGTAVITIPKKIKESMQIEAGEQLLMFYNPVDQTIRISPFTPEEYKKAVEDSLTVLNQIEAENAK
jgi:antitoxin component of MazEF toxin-antitoxin module